MLFVFALDNQQFQDKILVSEMCDDLEDSDNNTSERQLADNEWRRLNEAVEKVCLKGVFNIIKTLINLF